MRGSQGPRPVLALRIADAAERFAAAMLHERHLFWSIVMIESDYVDPLGAKTSIMKTSAKRTPLLVVGCILAIGGVTNGRGQQLDSPPGTYYSAKDPNFPPMPVNLHPELPVVEVEPGTFLVDDTGIPDTPEEAEAKARRAILAAMPVDQRLVEAAAEERRIQQEAFVYDQFVPWLQPSFPDEPERLAPRTLDDIHTASRARALVESEHKNAEHLLDQARVDRYLSRLPADTFPERPTRIDERGRPVFDQLLDVNQAKDTFATSVWTNATPSLNLKGDGVTVHMWDGGNVRTTHQELTGRAFNLQTSPLINTNHATHVAGIIAARGTNATAIGIAPNARILAADLDGHYAEILSQIGTNGLLQSNHSYGNLSLGWSGTSFFIDTGHGINGTYPTWYGSTNLSYTEDPYFGYYAYDATNIDTTIYNHPTTVMCWAAGNERGAAGQPVISPSSGFAIFNSSGNRQLVHPVYGNWFTPPGNDGSTRNGYFTLDYNSAAKNSIVVSATTANAGGYTGTNSVANASYSSRGPARDGRIKPDLAGVGGDTGLQVYSPVATANNAYSNDSGTSMATPNVAGSVALLRQCWSQYNPTNYPALASSVKALLVHGASQVGPNRGPNYSTGWGLINISNSVGTVRSNFTGFTLETLPLSHIKEIVLQNGATNDFTVTVPSGVSRLKVTLAWTDPVGPVAGGVTLTNGVWLASQRALVNNVDLRIIGNGQTYLPWILDPLQYQQPATRGDDNLNNVEVAEVDSPAAGTYTVRVSHKGTLTGACTNAPTQTLSLVITGNIDDPVPQLNITQTGVITTQTNKSLAMSWPSVPGAVYHVLYRTNITDSSWFLATDPVTAGQTNTAVLLPIQPLEATRFYRLARVR